MGVISKMLYRSEELQPAPHRNLFLDMEENIHIHYRDLRIELSRAEFEEFSQTFSKQSAELLAIIEQKNYQDGKLPNANQDDTRIWTDSRLNHPVKYHPQRISIEECTDGYHLHLRNYKLLLNKNDFKTFLNAINSIDLDAPYAKSRKEILQLFEDNHIDFVVSQEDHPHETSYLQVANYHLAKIRAICEKIGLTFERLNNTYQIKNNLITLLVTPVTADKILPLKKALSMNSSSLLVSFLLNNKEDIDKNLLNHIKCQVLDLFSYVKQCEKTPAVDLNFLNWSYDISLNKVHFPFKISQSHLAPKQISALYRDWSSFLNANKLYFIKPSKIVFNSETQIETRHRIYTSLIEQVASVAAVTKIYIMGSLLRKDLGIYLSPFIHSQWAKLGSDVDILIEMQSAQSIVPEDWEYINLSQSNSCDIYHLNQVELTDRYGFQKEFPHISFFHHLIDAFVYFPGKSDEKKKQAFLEKFAAKLFYSDNAKDKLDIQFEVQQEIDDPWASKPIEESIKKNHKQIATAETEDLKKIKKTIKKEYGLNIDDLTKMSVATENSLFQFKSLDNAYILKCYKVSGNYRSKRIEEHALYEAKLLDCLSQTAVNSSELIKNKQASGVILIDQTPAILYLYAPGLIYKYPDPLFPIAEATQALATMHELQIKSPLALEKMFSFDDLFTLWYPEFYRFKNKVSNDMLLSKDFSKLKIIYKQLKNLYQKISQNTQIPHLHNHGDVTPRNFVINKGEATLIDFQNAFYGPRLFDVIDGAYEFSFGGKPPGKDDFSRFEQFIKNYQQYSKLLPIELSVLDDSVKVCGIIKFIKEVRMIKDDTEQSKLRRQRALSVSQFLINRYLPTFRC